MGLLLFSTGHPAASAAAPYAAAVCKCYHSCCKSFVCVQAEVQQTADLPIPIPLCHLNVANLICKQLHESRNLEPKPHSC